MIRFLITPLVVLICLVVWACQADAQPQPRPTEPSQCAVWRDMTSRLADQFDEQPLIVSINSRGAMVEFWGNLSTGTWTIMHTPPDRPTCIVDFGRDFDALPPQPQGDPT